MLEIIYFLIHGYVSPRELNIRMKFDRFTFKFCFVKVYKYVADGYSRNVSLVDTRGLLKSLPLPLYFMGVIRLGFKVKADSFTI